MPRAHKPKCTHERHRMGYLKVRCLTGTGRAEFSPVASCTIHERCLPKFGGPWDADRLLHEAQLYALCHLADGTSCPDYLPRKE